MKIGLIQEHVPLCENNSGLAPTLHALIKAYASTFVLVQLVHHRLQNEQATKSINQGLGPEISTTWPTSEEAYIVGKD